MVFSVALEREDRGNYWFTSEETDRFYRCTKAGRMAYSSGIKKTRLTGMRGVLSHSRIWHGAMTMRPLCHMWQVSKPWSSKGCRHNVSTVLTLSRHFATTNRLRHFLQALVNFETFNKKAGQNSKWYLFLQHFHTQNCPILLTSLCSSAVHLITNNASCHSLGSNCILAPLSTLAHCPLTVISSS